jgi:WXG100 family type VII secretion target
MSSGVSVDVDALQSTVGILRDATAAISRILTDLESEVRTLGGEWTGEASAAYAVAHRSWNSDLAVMRALLGDASEALNAANGRYAAADSEAASFWG